MVMSVTTTWSWPPAPVLRHDVSWLGQSVDDHGAEAVDGCEGADEARGGADDAGEEADNAGEEAGDDAGVEDEDEDDEVAGASAAAFVSPASVVPPLWLPVVMRPTDAAMATVRVPATISVRRLNLRGPLPAGRSGISSLMAFPPHREQMPASE
jgi:hypothetical protein